MVEWWNDMVERWNSIDPSPENPETTRLVDGAKSSSKPGESLVELLKRITPKTAAIMNDGRTSKELCDELYNDETGLPK
jgi:hypothetical protein